MKRFWRKILPFFYRRENKTIGALSSEFRLYRSHIYSSFLYFRKENWWWDTTLFRRWIRFLEQLVKPRPINWLKRLTAKTQAFALAWQEYHLNNMRSYRSTSAKLGCFFAFRTVISPHREWNFISVGLPVTFFFIWFLKFVNFTNWKWTYFFTRWISAYLIYGDFRGLFV